MSKVRPLTRAGMRNSNIDLWTVKVYKGKKVVCTEDQIWARNRRQALDRFEIPDDLEWDRLTVVKTK